MCGATGCLVVVDWPRSGLRVPVMNGEAENAPTRPSALLSSSIPTSSPQMPPAGRVVGTRRSVADRETFVARRRREETLARARQREEEKKNNAVSPQGERGPRKRPGPSRGRRAASVSPPRGRDRPLREATELLSQPLRSHRSSRGRRARSASPGSSARSRGRKYASIPSSGYGQQRDRALHATPGAGSPSGPEPSRMWHAIAQGSPADQPQQGSPAVVYERRRHMGNGGASKGTPTATPTPTPTPTPTRVVRETRGGKGRSAEVELLQTQEELLATKKRLYGTLEELQQHKRALAVKSEELMYVVGKVQDLMQTFSQLLHLALSRSRARGEDVTTHDAISRLAQTVLHQALADVPSMQHLRQTWEEQIASHQQQQQQQQPPSSPPAPSLRSLFAESQQQQEQQRLRPSGASEVAAASAGGNATWKGAFASHPSSFAPRPTNETPLPPWSKQPAERGVAGVPTSASPDGLAARLGALQQQLDAQERVPGFDTTAATGHYVSRPGATGTSASSGVRTNGSFDWRRAGAERESATRPFTPQRPGDGSGARTVASGKKEEGYWPAVARGDVEAPPAMRDWAVKLEAKPKYAVSSTRQDFPWTNSHRVAGDLRMGVQKLKDATPEGVLLGSGELATELDRMDLIDEYRLLVHPRITGHGPTLYQSGLPSTRRLELISAKPLSNGAVAMHYRRERG